MIGKPVAGDIVEVMWDDSNQLLLGWTEASDYVAAGGSILCQTAGYYVGEHNGHVVICLSAVAHNRHTSQGISIPRVAIVSLTIIRKANKELAEALR